MAQNFELRSWGFPKHGIWPLNKGIWDPELRGTNLKSLKHALSASNLETQALDSQVVQTGMGSYEL